MINSCIAFFFVTLGKVSDNFRTLLYRMEIKHCKLKSDLYAWFRDSCSLVSFLPDSCWQTVTHRTVAQWDSSVEDFSYINYFSYHFHIYLYYLLPQTK